MPDSDNYCDQFKTTDQSENIKVWSHSFRMILSGRGDVYDDKANVFFAS